MNTNTSYDYIICGAGCAGLSLLIRMIESQRVTDKRILLVDKEEKIKNDRTWCFWETEPDIFETLVYKSWDKLWYHDTGFSRLMKISPYQYKMIRGIDFYNYCLNIIRQQKNIELQYGHVESVATENEKAVLYMDGHRIEASYIFNSVLFDKPQLKRKEYLLLQHFKGWIIETGKPVFNAREATMMDFRIKQEDGIAFVYIMPFTETKALVEYTLFSTELLPAEKYDAALKNYLKQYLATNNYKLLEEEFGVIPMTNYQFPLYGDKVINIGTAGGQTKGSSGYTFKFIQKHSKALLNQLIETGNPVLPQKTNRFKFYDSILLSILYHKELSASQIFTPIIKKNKPQQLLRFMDNESSLKDDLKIISGLPTLPFLKAAIKQF